MKNLPVFALSHEDYLVQPEDFHDVDLKSQALSIMTDFRSHKPHMVNGDDSALSAFETMRHEGLKHKLVVDNHYGLIGVVNLDQLSTHNLQLKRSELGATMSEITVADVMTKRAEIKAIDFEIFAKASVEDVVASFQKSAEPYLFVVDSQEHQIRGVVSSAMIASRLHRSIEVQRPLNFVDIFSAVRGASI